MTFKLAKREFETALNLVDDEANPAMTPLIRGLHELATAMERMEKTLKSDIDGVEHTVKSYSG